MEKVESPQLDSKISPTAIFAGVVIGVIVALVMTLGNVLFLMWGAISVVWEWYPAVAVLNGVMMTTAAFLVVLFAGFIARRRSVRAADLVFILSMVTMITAITSGMILLEQYYYFVGAVGINPSLKAYMPQYWAPNDLTSFITGGQFSWGDWAPTIAIYFGLVFTWALMLIFLVSIWRGLIIEVQRVPFPAAIPYTQQFDLLVSTDPEKPRFFSFKGRARFFWVGFIIGALFALPDIIAIVVPGFPTIMYSTAVAVQDYSPALSQSLPGATLAFAANPFVMAIAMLVPLEISMSFWGASWVAGLLIAPLLFALKLTPWAPGYGLWGTWGTTLKPLVLLGDGMLVGLFVAPLLLNRDFFINGLKAVFGRKSNGFDEMREAASYRLLYIGFIVSAIAFIGLGLIYSSNIAGLIMLAVFSVIVCIASTYITGYTNQGLHFMYEFWLTTPITSDVMIAAGGPVTARFYPAVGAVFYPGYEPMYVNPGVFTAFLYKVADDMKVHSRVVLKAVIPALLIGMAIGWPLTPYLITTLGGAARIATAWIWSAWGGRGAGHISADVVGDPPPGARNWQGLTGEELYGGLVAGIIFAVVLIALRSRFSWFGINAAAVWMGWGTFGYIRAFEFFIGWLVKLIVVRFGGARVYDRYFVPLIAGWIVGITAFEFTPHIWYFAKYLIVG